MTARGARRRCAMAMRDTLRATGYDVTYVKVPDGVHAPATWTARLPVGIAALMGRK